MDPPGPRTASSATAPGIDRVICNVLLTAGALIIAVGFSAAKTVGIGNLDVLGAYEAAGIAIMFGGFLALGKVGVRRAGHIAIGTRDRRVGVVTEHARSRRCGDVA